MQSKRLFVLLGLAWAIAARAHAFTLPDGCGNDSVQFKVKTTKGQPLPPPEAGKAQIVFIERLDGAFSGAPTTRFAVDGAWAGATRGASFLTFSVTPGTHHLCASRQSSINAEKENVGVATVNAEAGKVYFYEFKIIRTEVGDAAMKGGAALPGQYPGSMTAKPKDTMDQVAFTQLSDEEAKASLKNASLSTSAVK